MVKDPENLAIVTQLVWIWSNEAARAQLEEKEKGLVQELLRNTVYEGTGVVFTHYEAIINRHSTKS